jgi:cytochrome c
MRIFILSAFALTAMSASSPMAQTTPSPAASFLAAGNATRGASLYTNRCGGCHSIEINRVGPAHRGVVGRRAGTSPSYNYSPALKAGTITFNEATLDRWLTNPQATVPGARMFFRLGAAQERADVIAYLKTQTAPR